MWFPRFAHRAAAAIGFALCAPPALASPDGIQLTVTETSPTVTLHWTGGSPPYDVYRATIAPTITDAPYKIATTSTDTLVDVPPAGGIHFYVVTSGCPAGTEACGSGCSDLSADSVHCGACGVTCREGTTCVSGACVCNDVICPSGCSDPTGDSFNCGACGVVCGLDSYCQAGACICDGPCANQRPTANAGSDQPNVVDVDADGDAYVSLDASASDDPDGSIVLYEWREANALLSSGPGPTAQVMLPEGTHVVTVTVTDELGAAEVDDLTVTVLPGSSSAHPKLIISGPAFHEMRDRAAVEPWASMRADAIATSNAGYVPGSSNPQIATNLTRFSSASALAYILDEPNARLYATRVRDAILNYVDLLAFGTDWSRAVPPAHALFNLTLSLDVVFNHLTAAEVASTETKLQQKVNLVYTGDWKSAGLGAIGTWNVYKGTRTTPDNPYYDSLMSSLSMDGVFLGGRCYGWARWNGLNRYVKNMYMDVLEHTGIDPRYYQNPRVQGLYEWLYGHGGAVFGGPISFGDCAIESWRGGVYDEPPLYRAGKFGVTAAEYAATHLPPTIAGNLVSYVVPDGPLPPGSYPTSKVYADGGGFFMERMSSPAQGPTAMGGSLWNVRSSEGHSHYEVNAIALSGYNEYLLVNAGYAGWGYAIPGYSWSWIHDDERSANTLRTSRHASKAGGGVVEGFTDALLDYASGDDGPALADDVHLRNFVFVHRDGAARPYFVLFDEVTAESGELILMNLHPNTLSTTGIQTVVAGTEFTAPIDAVAVVPGRAKLTVFYATPPNTVRHLNGGVATWEWDDGGFTGRYLESEYATPASGLKNIVTVLFPHDPDHAKATMSRLSISGFTGATIDHGSGTVDTALESSAAASLAHDGDTFTGKALLCRKASGANVFYFVRNGTSFSTTNGPANGFSSLVPVSITMRGTVGRIVSPGTRVRFTYPRITGVRINGSLAPNVGADPDWVEVDVPSGTHTVELVTN